MKITLAFLTSAIMATSVAARGAAKTGKSKGKGSEMMEEEDTCVCDGPVTTATVSTVLDPVTMLPTNITTVAEAIAATPENCTLIVPTTADLLVYPSETEALAPVLKDTELVAACQLNSAALPDGCTLDWFFLDGSPVPSTIGGAGTTAQWITALPLEPIVTAVAGTDPADPVQFETTGAGTELTAYYSCCLTNEAYCLDFTEPLSEAPTSASGKGKGSRRFV